ncbi:MAG: hypothetical protein ACRCUS_09385 [Anaerovoracaceae bacterium]
MIISMNKKKKVLIIVLIAFLLLLAINYRYIWTKSMELAIKKENVPAVATLANFPFTNLNSYNINYLLFWNWFPEVDYDTALTLAIKEGNYELVKTLIDNGADVNYCNVAKGISPIEAVFLEYNEDDLNILLLLLNNKVNVNAVTAYADTLLFQIAYQDCGTKGKMKGDKWEYNAIITKKITKEFTLVYERSRRKEGQDKYSGYNSLFATGFSGNLSLMKFLLYELKYDPNIKNNMGMTPLFVVFSEVNEVSWTKKTISLLLEYGADKSIKDNEGKIAYDYAKEEGAPKEILKLLKL